MPYPFELPQLPYDYDAVEPHIDARTMEIHHQKHHGGYTSKLNAALEGHSGFHNLTAEQLLRGISALPEEIRDAVRKNGGGYHNHGLFWDILTPDGHGLPTGDLRGRLEETFGAFESFKETFEKAAVSRFGSGWAWLVIDPLGHLKVISTPNQDSPLMEGHTPILGVDVWEHAYYLKYQNRRADYLNAFWEAVNWGQVQQRFEQYRGGWIDERP